MYILLLASLNLLPYQPHGSLSLLSWIPALCSDPSVTLVDPSALSHLSIPILHQISPLI